MTVNEYLDRLTDERFVWGRCDCFLFISNWIVACGWADPAEPYRGKYKSERGAQRHILKAGGTLQALTEKRMAAVGLPETKDPTVNDVGLVEGLNGPTLCISIGKHWVGKAELGIVFGRPNVIKAWMVPCL